MLMSATQFYDVHFALNGDEIIAFEKYREKIGCSQAGAIICLIRGALMGQSDLHKSAFQDILDEKRLNGLDSEVSHLKSVLNCLCTHDEKLDEQIADLDEKFDKLTSIVNDVLQIAREQNNRPIETKLSI